LAKKTIIFLFALFLLAGCGYRLVGLGNSLPEHIKKIHIGVFKNRSYEYGLESVLTQEVVRAFDKRAGIIVVKEQSEADASLEGEIAEYEYVPSVNSQRKVTQYYINIRAEIRFRDLIKDEVYWEDKNFMFSEIYKVTGGLSTIQANRQKAWQDAAEDFAETIAGVLLEGF